MRNVNHVTFNILWSFCSTEKNENVGRWKNEGLEESVIFLLPVFITLKKNKSISITFPHIFFPLFDVW